MVKIIFGNCLNQKMNIHAELLVLKTSDQLRFSVNGIWNVYKERNGKSLIEQLISIVIKN